MTVATTNNDNLFELKQFNSSDDYVECPFTVIIDTREQQPYSFTGIAADVNKKNKPLLIPIEVATLRSGDYSIQEHEQRITVERKSLVDLYGTLGQGRDRFVAELERLNEMDVADVVVEAGWPTILKGIPQSKLRPKTIYRSVLAWKQRFRRVHWNFCDTRNFAERTTFRILERYWKDLKR